MYNSTIIEILLSVSYIAVLFIICSMFLKINNETELVKIRLDKLEKEMQGNEQQNGRCSKIIRS